MENQLNEALKCKKWIQHRSWEQGTHLVDINGDYTQEFDRKPNVS